MTITSWICSVVQKRRLTEPKDWTMMKNALSKASLVKWRISPPRPSLLSQARRNRMMKRQETIQGSGKNLNDPSNLRKPSILWMTWRESKTRSKPLMLKTRFLGSKLPKLRPRRRWAPTRPQAIKNSQVTLHSRPPLQRWTPTLQIYQATASRLITVDLKHRSTKSPSRWFHHHTGRNTTYSLSSLKIAQYRNNRNNNKTH